MPVYEITDPRTGRTLRLEGASPPTDEDLDMIFTEQEATEGMMAPSTAADPPPPSFNGAMNHIGRQLATTFASAFGPQARDAVSGALDNPKSTLASMAVPGIIGKAVKTAAPVLGPGLTKVGTMLEDPIAGGAVGAIEGMRRGKPVEGAVMGAASGTLIGRLAKGLGGKLSPGADPEMPAPPPGPVRGVDPVARLEGRTPGIVDRMQGRSPNAIGDETLPPPQTGAITMERMNPPPQSATQRSGELQDLITAAHGQGGRIANPGPASFEEGAEQALRGMLAEGGGRPGIGWRQQPMSHPSGGGYTVPPPAGANPAMDDAIMAARPQPTAQAPMQPVASHAPVTAPTTPINIEEQLRATLAAGKPVPGAAKPAPRASKSKSANYSANDIEHLQQAGFTVRDAENGVEGAIQALEAGRKARHATHFADAQMQARGRHATERDK